MDDDEDYTTCGAGNDQSPIDIIKNDAAPAEYNTLVLTGYGRAAGDKLENKGRTGKFFRNVSSTPKTT